MRAQVIPVDGPIEEVDVDSLDDLQAAVGGWIEGLPFWEPREDVAVYVNEEGKYNGSEVNHYATEKMRGLLQPGDRINGPLLVTGLDPETGETADLPADVDIAPATPDLPDEWPRELGDRSIDVLFPIGENDEGEWFVKFSCFHQKDASVFSGRGGKQFRAVIARECHRGNMVSFKLFSGLGIMSAPVERYSAKRLEEFTDLAHAALKRMIEEKHPRVLAQFELETKVAA